MLNIFSLALIFKKRYPLALLLMGIAWNFHPMSVVFLFLLLVPYWIVHRGEWGFKKLTLCAVAFVLPALPMLVKSLNYLAMHWEYGSEWMTGVKWTAWYTVFPSTWPLSYFFRAGLFLWLFVMGLYAFPASEKKRDSILFIVTIGTLCMVGTVFTEVYPIPFVMKLSLWRTSWLYIILSLPFIVHLLIAMWDHTLLKRFSIVATLIVIAGYIHYFPSYYLLLFNTIFLLFLLEPQLIKRWKWVYEKLPFVFLAVLLTLSTYQGLFDWGAKGTLMGLVFIVLFLLLVRIGETSLSQMKRSRLCIGSALLFIILFDAGILLYRGGPDIYYHGHVRGKRDPWADVQFFAKEHSKKDALFIVPPYSNDFGLYSERATLGDWAEGANILYMDNAFAKEWLARMNDLGWKTFLGSRSGYNALSTEQILVTAQKYSATYIVTEKPKHFELPIVYGNEAFILYQVPGSE
jgi:Na+-transporting methylmalonyl-CoA/oxaloacetate decarboxylase gamma subunit